MRAASQSKGVFCIEGNWEEDLSIPSSVRPLLELLRINEGIPYIHRECATKEELQFYLEKWTQQKYSRFPILYLASHGESFSIKVGRNTIDLDELAEMLGPHCKNRILMVSSCSTMKVDLRRLKSFLSKSHCLALLGYRTDVDWMRSAALELLIFYEIQANEFSGRGIKSIESKVETLAKSFSDLELRMVTV